MFSLAVLFVAVGTSAAQAATRNPDLASQFEAAQDGPLNRAHTRMVSERERLMVGDLRLCNHAWPDSTMWPCGAVDDERVADVHVTCMTGRSCARALER